MLVTANGDCTYFENKWLDKSKGMTKKGGRVLYNWRKARAVYPARYPRAASRNSTSSSLYTIFINYYSYQPNSI